MPILICYLSLLLKIKVTSISSYLKPGMLFLCAVKCYASDNRLHIQFNKLSYYYNVTIRRWKFTRENKECVYSVTGYGSLRRLLAIQNNSNQFKAGIFN